MGQVYMHVNRLGIQRIGGKIGIIQDPFGTNGAPVYLGATTPIPNAALRQLSLDQNGMLYATALVEDTSGQYTNGQASDLIYNSMFVWNSSQLIQAALDAQLAGRKLAAPFDRNSANPFNSAQLPAVTPARYDTANGRLFGWIYGVGTYSASQNIPTLTLQDVPYLKELAPSVFTEAKAAAVQAHEPVAKDTSNGTWNTAMILAGAQLTQTYAFMAASLQSVFGEDNSAMLAKMNEAQSVMNTIGFDTQASGLGGLAAKGTELVAGFTGGMLSVGMNTAGYAMRGFAETENLFHPGFVKDMPAPTDLLQLHDSGATIGEQINHVATAFIMPVVDGGLALIKGGADLMLGNWISARNNLMDGLATLLMFKGGGEMLGPKVAELKSQTQLKIKQALFKAQEVMQGIITKSPLEFLRKGPEGREVIITEKTLPSNDPALPPVKVTEIKTTEQAAKDCADGMTLNPDGTISYRMPSGTGGCFIAGTLVHTKEGLKPIEQIKVGDWVLSKPEDGTGEQAYKRVVNTFKHEDKEVMLVEILAPSRMWKEAGNPPLSTAPNELKQFLVTTPNHPFWVKEVGWTAARVLLPYAPELSKLVLASGETVQLNEAGALYQTPLAPGKVWFMDPDMHELGVIPVDYSYGAVQADTVAFELSPDINMGCGGATGEREGALRQTVYNIEVEDWHTYYVGKFGVWVHNANCLEAVTNRQVNEAYQKLDNGQFDALPSEIDFNGLAAPHTGLVIAKENMYVGNRPTVFQQQMKGAKSVQQGSQVTFAVPALRMDVTKCNRELGTKQTQNFVVGDALAEMPGQTGMYSKTIIDASSENSKFVREGDAGNLVLKTNKDGTPTILNYLKTKSFALKENPGFSWVLVIENETGFKMVSDYIASHPEIANWLSKDLYIVKAEPLLDGALQRELPATLDGFRLSRDAYGNDVWGTVGFDKAGVLVPLEQAYVAPTSGVPQKVSVEGAAANPQLLAQEDVNSLIPAAKQYWLNAGALTSVLDGIQINIGQLPTAVAAQAQSNKITLSEDGAGWGWFVDSTPLDSIEFINPTSTQWIAPADSIASGKLDLLTVMIHEMGHALGLRHDASGAMEALLQPGERNLPSDLEAALLQNIRKAVTAQTTNFVAPPPVRQYEVVANPSFASLATLAGWSTQGSVEFRNQQSGIGNQGVATLREVSTSQTRLSQVFMLNEQDRYLSFTLSGTALDDLNGAPVMVKARHH